MGGSQSSTCKKVFQNPDLLNVVTLSDSAVQRLPMDAEDSPLDNEKRKQNVDDYWRDRLICLDDSFSEAKSMTEKDFNRLEFAIKKMSPDAGKVSCPRNTEDAATCYMVFAKEPLKCNHLVRKMELCMDTMAAESARRRYLDDLRKAKKVC